MKKRVQDQNIKTKSGNKGAEEKTKNLERCSKWIRTTQCSHQTPAQIVHQTRGLNSQLGEGGPSYKGSGEEKILEKAFKRIKSFEKVRR